jgi:hypothetical protein|tara:strand:- start:121 stop:498 length:378 start_codon:yes stop_codon:yes gene_type:complete
MAIQSPFLLIVGLLIGAHMAETVFIKSKFIKVSEQKTICREDADSLWGGKSKRKEDVEYELHYEYSDCFVDGEQLSIDVNRAIEDLIGKGLTVISITPVTSGQYGSSLNSGYGFSYTEGMLIAAI